MARLTFWFELASTYSYLSAMRIEEMARKADVEVIWKPFLLGPIFKAQNWDTSPFNIYPAKGRYMVRDIERIARERGLEFCLPHPFPQNGLLAARLAIVGLEEGWGPAFIRSIFKLQFAEEQNIAERSTLATALAAAGTPENQAFGRAQSAEVKSQLRANTEAAQAKGIFGAPSFTTENGELFWGDDRLDHALLWSRKIN